jgi:hypothetical protein
MRDVTRDDEIVVENIEAMGETTSPGSWSSLLCFRSPTGLSSFGLRVCCRSAVARAVRSSRRIVAVPRGV